MKPILLAPAGSWPMLRASIRAGAEAVYFGLKDWNMRAFAQNFNSTELPKIVKFCHQHQTQAFLTINTIIYDDELQKIEKIINQAKQAQIDAIICWDPAVISLVKKNKIPVHISTQASVSNFEAIKFYHRLGAKSINLARECSLKQIKEIVKKIKKKRLGIKVETFIHGAMCLSISGRCLLSQGMFKKSANRGECLHPCRRAYQVKNLDTGDELEVRNQYIFSPKDICALPILDKLIDSGISMFKIEGRNKNPEYAQIVTKVYREAIDFYWQNKTKKSKAKQEFKKEWQEKQKQWLEELKKVYNRGFSTGFFLGTPTNDDFAVVSGSKAVEYKLYSGMVKNFYDKPRVAEVLIENKPLKIGDNILILGNKTGVFKQKITSMEINHQPVKEVKKGRRAGIKLEQKARKNDKVFIVKKRK